MDDTDLIGPLLPIGLIATAIFALVVSGIFIVGGIIIVGAIFIAIMKFLLEIFIHIVEGNQERKQAEVERAALVAKTAKTPVKLVFRASVITSLYEPYEPATAPHFRQSMNDVGHEDGVPQSNVIQLIAEQNRLKALRGQS